MHADVFLLGAGKPAAGGKPAALKELVFGKRALDWQIESFRPVCPLENICYLGGYQVDEVLAQYPTLRYTVVADWEHGSILETFLSAPFKKGATSFVAYADTVFHAETIQTLAAQAADVVYGVDSAWQKRYEGRSAEDMAIAETITVKGEPHEFTGLIRFSPKVTDYLADVVDAKKLGRNLRTLLDHLKQAGFSVEAFDVAGHWAEFNASLDIAHLMLGSKAKTLARLKPALKSAFIGAQQTCVYKTWQANKQQQAEQLAQYFKHARLIMRSSSRHEDGWQASNAGGFDSVADVDGSNTQAVINAVDAVFASYGESLSPNDQVLVQEYITNTKLTGVVFTCSIETGAPYYWFEFDDETGTTNAVTAGTTNATRIIVCSRFATQAQLAEKAPELQPVLKAVQEVEQLLGYDKLDIEFCVDTQGRVHIFQVRPIAVDHAGVDVDSTAFEQALFACTKHIETAQHALPQVKGSKTILANMPDWNPAEMIGIRPKPFAASLYAHLITNTTWANQRAEFGYKDVRPTPLMHMVGGQPYIDARASLNSFIPASVPAETHQRVAEAYIKILEQNPHLQDKIEFDVAFTVWVPRFTAKAMQRLAPFGVTAFDVDQLEAGFKTITRTALTRLATDKASAEKLKARRAEIVASNLPPAHKIYALVEDCKAYGTLAFAHAARAGFVATTLLKSLVEENVLSDERRLAFLNSVHTVASDLQKNKNAFANGTLDKTTLFEMYGHLRPGTYEVTAEAYWEDPAFYLLADAQTNAQFVAANDTGFEFTQAEKQGLQHFLKELGADIPVEALVAYCAEAIQAREEVKFNFTHNISLALDLLAHYAESLNLSRHDASYLTYADIVRAVTQSTLGHSAQANIAKRKARYALTQHLALPAVLLSANDVYCFEQFLAAPNYIGINKVIAPVHFLKGDEHGDLKGKIVCIAQADPGYDWLFGRGIAGLVTQFGGANSHMAIRAAEIGLPAAIGVGDTLFVKLSAMRAVELDCANHILREVK